MRVHAKLCKLWVGIDERLLSQVATQGAGEVFFTFWKLLVHREQVNFFYILEIAGAQGAGEILFFQRFRNLIPPCL